MRQVERSVFLAAHGTKRLRRSQRASRADQRPGAAVAEVLARKYCDHSRKRAKQLEPLIRELRDKNYSVTMELNKRKVPTPRHGRWGCSFFSGSSGLLTLPPTFIQRFLVGRGDGPERGAVNAAQCTCSPINRASWGSPESAVNTRTAKTG